MVLQNEFPIRALAIAPYEAMTTSLRRMADEFPHLQMEAYTGDLLAGLAIAENVSVTALM